MDVSEFNNKVKSGEVYDWYQGLGPTPSERYDEFSLHFRSWTASQDFAIRAQRAMANPPPSPFTVAHLEGRLLDLFLNHAVDHLSKDEILRHGKGNRSGMATLAMLEAHRLLVPLIYSIPAGTI